MSDKKKRIEQGLNRFDRIVISVESVVAVAAFAGMCLIVMYGIICRFILKIPNPYGEELSRYLMIYAVFFAVAIGVVKNEHIRVDFFVDRLPGMAGKLVDVLGGLVTVFGYLLLTYLTAQVFGSMIQKGQLAPSLRIPMYIPYAGMLVGMALAALQAVEMFIRKFFLGNRGEEGES